MSVFSSKFKKIAKKATSWSLAALTATACAGSLPAVTLQAQAAASMLSNADRGVIYANSRTDFRDESIYFVITTRFYDGDSSNNARTSEDTKAQNPESDPSWRGDFKGLIDKLDYIKALGFTAIWITPVVENNSGYDYHGYHAYDFSAVDKRYESNGVTYQTLIDACHAKGMKVIQDIVLNHTCNWGERNLLQLTSDVYGERNQAVMNGSNDPENIYHHNGFCGGGDWDEYAAQNKTIADDCFDLETENPKVYNYLKDCYVNYINMGVDGFRVDTVKHISRLTLNSVFVPAFKEAGGDDFYMFGEVCTKGHDVWYRGNPPISTAFYTWAEDGSWANCWTNDLATNESLVEQHYTEHKDTSKQPTSTNAFLNGNEYHTPDYSMRSGLDSIDFQMHWSFNSANSAFNTALYEDQYFNDSTWNVVYVDSHDYGPDECQTLRYNGGTDAWAENLSLMFTFRGIPCVYYGSEIEFQAGKPIDVGPNAPLSETGRAYYGDHIEGDISTSDFTVITSESGTVKDTLDSTLSQHIMRLNRLRQSIPALRKGQYSTEGCSGNMAFKRRYTDSSTDSFVCVAISGDATFTGIPNGTYVDAVTGDTQTVSGGTLTAKVSGKGNMKVYVLDTAKTPAPGRVIPNGTYLTDGGAAETIGVSGDAPDPIAVTGISLDKTSVTVKAGESATVTATVAPSNATNKTVKWTSSDTSVATVSNGTIKGVSAGTATITATTNNGKTATVKVTVQKNDSIVQPTGITVSPTTLTLTEGNTSTITATVTPSNATDKSVTWTSNKTSVATVSNGTVTAVSEGTATITAKTSNGLTATVTVTVEKSVTPVGNAIYFEKPSSWGSNVYVYIYDPVNGNQTATASWPGDKMTLSNGLYTYELTTNSTTLKVLFNDNGNNQCPAHNEPGFDYKNNGYYTENGFQKIYTPEVAVTSVSLSKSTVSVQKGSTATLTATVSPSNATDKTITWTSSNTSVATVSNGVVTGVAKGTATITAKTSNGKTATATVTVTESTAALTNNSTLSATSIALGKSITATGKATGGTGSYQYQVVYKRTSQTTWTTAQAYKSNATVTFTPAAATTYDVCVKVKDSAGTEVKKFFTVTVSSSKELTNSSTLSATTITLGDSITATGKATGGTGSYQYQVVYKQTSQTSWTTAQAYKSNATVTFKPAKATTYDVCVKVKDSAGTEVKKFFTVTVQSAAVTMKISATQITLGNTVTASATAPSGYKYAFYYKQTAQSTWTEKQAFSTNKSVAIKPAKATTYDICIKVKDTSGNIQKKYFTLTVKQGLTNTSTLSAASISLGKTITANCSATGGTGYYNYAVLYKRTSQTAWTTVQGFKANETVTIKPQAATTYDVCVKVQDSDGTIEKKFFTVKVTNSALTNNSKLSSTSISKGSSVTATAVAAGGTGSYQYAFYYKQTTQSTWTTKQDFSSNSVTSIKPANTGTYDICIKVKDSAGTVAKKYFTVTVK